MKLFFQIIQTLILIAIFIATVTLSNDIIWFGNKLDTTIKRLILREPIINCYDVSVQHGGILKLCEEEKIK